MVQIARQSLADAAEEFHRAFGSMSSAIPSGRGKLDLGRRRIRADQRKLESLITTSSVLRDLIARSISVGTYDAAVYSIRTEIPRWLEVAADKKERVVALLQANGRRDMASEYGRLVDVLVSCLRQIQYLAAEGERMVALVGSDPRDSAVLARLRSDWMAKLKVIETIPGMTRPFAKLIPPCWEVIQRHLPEDWTPPGADWAENEDGAKVFRIDWRRPRYTFSVDLSASGTAEWFFNDRQEKRGLLREAPLTAGFPKEMVEGLRLASADR